MTLNIMPQHNNCTPQVAKVVAEECSKLHQLQKQNSETLWSVPENFQLSLEDVAGEVIDTR